MEAPAAGLAWAAEEEPAPIAQILARPEPRGGCDVEVGSHGRRQQPAALLGIDAGEHLLLEVVVQEPGRRPPVRLHGARRQHDPQRPALCALHKDVDLVGRRFAAARHPQVRLALLRRRTRGRLGRTRRAAPRRAHERAGWRAAGGWRAPPAASCCRHRSDDRRPPASKGTPRASRRRRGRPRAARPAADRARAPAPRRPAPDLPGRAPWSCARPGRRRRREGPRGSLR